MESLVWACLILEWGGPQIIPMLGLDIAEGTDTYIDINMDGNTDIDTGIEI